jgi:hypothetical protein
LLECFRARSGEPEKEPFDRGRFHVVVSPDSYAPTIRNNSKKRQLLNRAAHSIGKDKHWREQTGNALKFSNSEWFFRPFVFDG